MFSIFSWKYPCSVKLSFFFFFQIKCTVVQDQGNLSKSIDVLVENIENNVIFVPFICNIKQSPL